MKQTIYLMHNNSEQAGLWLQHLPSESVEPIDIAPTNDMVNLLEQAPRHSLPSLILIEMSIQVPGSNLLQASKVSRWCKENQPSIKIVLLTMRHEYELTNLEQRWAVKQGAICILARLEPYNLRTKINQIYEYLNLEPPVITLSAVSTPALKQGRNNNAISDPKKDFNAAISHLKKVIEEHKESVDTSSVCNKIYAHCKSFEQVIQDYMDYLDSIEKESKRQKLRSIGERFAQLNRSNDSGHQPTGVNHGRKSALDDFILG